MRYSWFENKSQFHYGSIKTKIHFITKNGDFSLNSTMVRLKLTLLNAKVCWIKKSQFHYGSIKTINGFQINKILMVVSIPLWFD